MQTYMKQTMVNMQKKNKHGNMQTYMETNHGKHAKKNNETCKHTWKKQTWQTFTYLG